MQPQPETEGFTFDPREILKMLFRRRIWLVLSILAGAALAIAAIALQKPLYRSSATLLIDSQQIPTSLVASPLTSIANERISKIRQQIMSRESLTAIIHQHELYPDEQRSLPFDQVLNIMRGAIAVDLVQASPTQGNTGQTIAFTIAFTYSDPANAQAVTTNLTELFLQEDLRFRTEQATGTTAFLARRAEELGRQLSELEERRRTIEARYAGALPQQMGLAAQSESTLRAEISQIDSESQVLMQQNSVLAAREQELQQAPRPEDEALRRAEEKLRDLNAVYSDSHPDVVAARAAVERHRLALRNLSPNNQSLIQTEISAGRDRLASLSSRRAQLVEEMGAAERRTALAPQASYELTVVEREYDNIRRQYEDLREKQLEAQVTANLQTEGKGEHFSVIDEPSLPMEPDGQKPMILFFMGLVAGAAAGAVVIVGYEFLGGTIHGEASLTRLLGSAPFGVVPLDYGPASTIFGLRVPSLFRTAKEGFQT